MKKTLKRTLAMIMSLSMLASMTAFTASAEEFESESTVSDSVTEEDSTTELNSYENFFGYELPEDYDEGRIKDLKHRMSFFDTFVIDDGYTLNDILNGYCFIGSNHFKATGKWGDNVEWVYDHGKLTISGNGPIKRVYASCGPDYIEGANAYVDPYNLMSAPSYVQVYPWSTFVGNISEIVVEDGITEIPTACFAGVSAGIKKMTFGNSVKSIDANALYFGRSYDDGEPLDIYFSEQNAITRSMNSPANIFHQSHKKITVHGYKNSPMYYYIEGGKKASIVGDNVVFESLGDAEGKYSEHRYSGDGGYNYTLDYDYKLDANKNTLDVIWDGKDDDCLGNFVSTKNYPTEIIGNIDESKSYCDYIKKIVVGDGIKKIGALESCKNLEILVLPDSVEKILKPVFIAEDADTSKLTIVANKGTYAEEYAQKYGIKFVDLKEYNSGDATLNNVDINSTEPTQPSESSEPSSETAEETKDESLKLGDINLDGDVTIADAILLNKYLVGSVTLSEASQKNADCDKDGKLTSSDTLVILDYVVGSIDEIK